MSVNHYHALYDTRFNISYGVSLNFIGYPGKFYWVTHLEINIPFSGTLHTNSVRFCNAASLVLSNFGCSLQFQDQVN